MINKNTQTNLLPKPFGLNAHKYLKYFVIFTAWPILNIGVSITLYLFYFLVKEVHRKQQTNFLKLNKHSNKFYLFAFISVLSLLFSPWEKLNTSLLGDLQMQLQYIYWMLVAIFFMNFHQYINKEEFEKYLFIGLLLHTIHFFFFSVHIPIPFIRTYASRNGFVYTYLALWPLASGFIYKKYGKTMGNLSLFIVFLLMLLTDGRAGVVIILIENIFIYFIYNKTSAKLIRYVLLFFIPLFSFLSANIATEENRNALGDAAAIISPRISEFIKGKGTGGDLSFDKSWLTRKLMISKGLEIIQKYPFLGVGIGHFTEYQADLKELNSPEFSRLGGSIQYDEDYYNTRSAHNSYIHMLSEMGIIGFVALLLILLPIVFYALKKLYFLTITKDDLVLVSILGICIHFYTISSLPGTLTWFIIGIAYARKRNVFVPKLFKKKSNFSSI